MEVDRHVDNRLSPLKTFWTFASTHAYKVTMTYLTVIAIDALTGLAAMTLFVLADAFIHVAADLRVGIVVLAFLYFCAGLTRGNTRPANAWMKGLLVSSVGCAAFCAIGWNQILHITLAILISVAILLAICGVYTRRFSWPRALMLAPVAFTLVALFAGTGVPSLSTRFAIRRTMTPAAPFSIDGSDGKRIVSSDLRGRVVVLDFWATWCPACRRELPEIDKLYRRFQSSPDVLVWAVDVNSGGETPAKAADFLRQHGYILPVAFDSSNAADGLLSDSGFPSLIVLDKSGRIRLIHTGYDGSERLLSELSSTLDHLTRER
jgi:thiol-disulfide isomerase/thioredoxin